MPVGTEAPAFSLKGIHGETMSLDALLAAEKPVLLVFSDPNCGPCGALMPEVAKWQQEHADHFLTAIISRGTPAANQEKARSTGLGMECCSGRIVKSLEGSVQVGRYAERGRDHAEPSRGDTARGRIRSDPRAGFEVIRTGGQMPVEPADKVAAAADRPSPSRPSRLHRRWNGGAGSGAGRSRWQPDETFRRVRPRCRANFLGPTCGFCKRMANDLVEWEKQAGENDPRPIIITGGSVDANREFGFASTVLLDPNGAAMALYGTTGRTDRDQGGADGKILRNCASANQA
ncbi:MAG: redoxin domain-containing protein [Thermomicrobiales bacterium]